MMPVPEIDDVSVVFGDIKHMPKYSEVPDAFKNHHNPYVKKTSEWFFKGLQKNSIKPKEGVDETKAIKALKAILSSWEPKHEHKTAGVAYLMSQWFDIAA